MSGYTLHTPGYTYGPLNALQLRMLLLQDMTPPHWEMVLDVWNEKSAFTFKGPEVRGGRIPQRHNHESLNTYIKINSESQNQNIQPPCPNYSDIIQNDNYKHKPRFQINKPDLSY
jgi:hypothetical protein